MIILDIDDYAGYGDFGVATCLKKILRYLVKEINKYVDARFEDLYRKKSGTVNKGEPRIIWVKMINRTTLKDDYIMKLRTKYNEILEEVLFEEGHTYIIELISLNDDKFFSSSGELLADGRIQYWKEIDHIIKEFDIKKISLLPVAPVSQSPKKKVIKKSMNDQYHVDNRQHNRSRSYGQENTKGIEVQEYHQQQHHQQQYHQAPPQNESVQAMHTPSHTQQQENKQNYPTYQQNYASGQGDYQSYHAYDYYDHYGY